MTVLALGAFVGCSRDSDKDSAKGSRDGSEATQDEGAAGSSTSSSVEPDGSGSTAVPGQGTKPGGSTNDTVTGDGVDPAVRYPQLGQLTTAIVAQDEVAACAEVQSRLRTYRSIASKAPISDLKLLGDSLDEFEQNLYTAADQQDWGDRIVLRLTNVRRLWATALARTEEDAGAKAAAAGALNFLDEALEVDCPT